MQYDYIWSACRAIDVSISKLAPSDIQFEGTLKQLADWLGKSDRRMWRNRVLAAALAVQAGLVQDMTATDDKLGDIQDSEAFIFFLTMPGDMLGSIFAFAGTASLRLFSATSRQNRSLIRRTPQTAGMWRRNMCYAKCGHLANWDWKVLCAEDRPDACAALIPRDLAFFSPNAEQVKGGLHDRWLGDAHSTLSSNTVKELTGSTVAHWALCLTFT